MVKFIIVNPYDFMLYMKPYSHPLRAMSQLFYKINSVQYMKDHGIEIVTLVDFVDDINLKYELRDFSCCEKYYLNHETTDNTFFKNVFYDCVTKLMNDIRTTNAYDNSIIYGIQPMGYDPFLKTNGNGLYDTKNYEYLQEKNIKVMLYSDDLHGYSKVYGITMDKIVAGDKTKFTDIRLDRAEYILSHGAPYFKYLDVYVDKTLLYFTPVDDVLFSMYTPQTFYERTNKIVLTGAIAGYPLRLYLYSNIVSKNPVAIKYYEHLSHFGSSSDIDVCKTGGIYAYYGQLAKYRGSFVGYYQKPIDHLLYKTFETLVSGTLLFSEEKEALANIGMIKYVHYVPVSEENMFDEKFLDTYLNTDVGKKIAINGYNFVKEYLSNKKNLDFFIDLINKIENKK